MSKSQLDVDSLVGGNILGLITHGIYANPLAIYREYIQNAADAIASSDNPDNGKVTITIDPRESCVTIRDNGPGLSYQQAKQTLIPISKSNKHVGQDRGFRGVGRLSGLAFSKLVRFLTRCSGDTRVTKVVWDGDQLRSSINKKFSVREIISSCVTIEEIDEGNYPVSFFEVQIEGISRYAASSILNPDTVINYLQEVCPVPFCSSFPYASQVANLFEKKPFALDIYLNEEEQRITRPHKNNLQISPKILDGFIEFEKIQIPEAGDGEIAAIGWIAHSSYLGVLPKKLGVRCLRVRAGNIQIGGETVFDHLFPENRFNRWCVAEIHVLDPRIVPNGRRDYFEPSAHVRNLENHLGAICRKLEKQCRMASQARNKQKHIQFSLEKLEAAYELATSGYLTADVADRLVNNQAFEIDNFRKKYESFACKSILKRLDEIKEKKNSSQTKRGSNSFENVAAKHVSTYRKIFDILAENSSSPQAAKEMIETILQCKSN